MEMYRRPANRFVAEFVGSPAMNFLPGEILRGEDGASQTNTLGVRPHDVTLVPPGAGTLDALVDVVEPRGSELLVYLRLGSDGSGPELRVITPPETSVEAEQVVGVRLDPTRLHWFDQKSGKRV